MRGLLQGGRGGGDDLFHVNTELGDRSSCESKSPVPSRGSHLRLSKIVDLRVVMSSELSS